MPVRHTFKGSGYFISTAKIFLDFGYPASMRTSPDFSEKFQKRYKFLLN
jgi:hypothetical protein